MEMSTNGSFYRTIKDNVEYENYLELLKVTHALSYT